MTMIELADNSLVTPGVFADSALDIVKRGCEYGFGLSGPEARCVAAYEDGRTEYIGNHGRISKVVPGMNALIVQVMAYLIWLAEGTGKFEWDRDKAQLTLTPT